MLSALTRNDREAKEAAMIARRRALEDDRRQRVLNPRLRTIGVDVGALDAQVRERHSAKEVEAMREQGFSQMVLDAQRQLEELERYFIPSSSITHAAKPNGSSACPLSKCRLSAR
jgi:hypothetical protein